MEAGSAGGVSGTVAGRGRHTVKYADLAAPVAIAVAAGAPAGWLYSVAQPDILPQALLTLGVTIVSLAAISRGSKRLARAARLLVAITATWMLADIALRFGVPPYVALPVAALFYRYIAVSASLIGGVFGRAMGPVFIFAALLVSLVDLALVYKAKLYFASASLRGGMEELVADFRSYVLGFADLLWYAAAIAVASPAKIPLVAAAIYLGLAATMRLAEPRGYAPALPLPLLMSSLALYLPIA